MIGGPYRRILTPPGAWEFSAAAAVARLPMAMVGIGIVLVVSAGYGSYALAGRVSAVNVVAAAMATPQVSRLVDRRGQARVMRPLLAACAGSLTVLVVVASAQGPEWMLYVAAAACGATQGSFGAMVRARWSALVAGSRDLHTAFSLETAIDDVIFAVGPVAATFAATAIGPPVALVIPIAAMIAGGYWFLGQRRTEPPTVETLSMGPKSQAWILRSGAMAALVLIFSGIGMIFGATTVTTVAFAEERGNEALAGPLLALFALASVASGLLYGARHWVGPLWRRFLFGVLALAVGTSLFLLASSFRQLAAAMLAAGFAIGPTLIAGNGLIQKVVPPARLTEGLTWGGTATGIGVALGSSAAGSAIDAAGARGGYLVLAGAGVACVLLAASGARALRAGSH